MTRYKIVRIKEATYQKIIKNAIYGESFDTVLDKVLNKVTMLHQNAGGIKHG